MSAWLCVHRGAQGLRANWPEAQGQAHAAALAAAALWRYEPSTPSGHEQTARSAGIRGDASGPLFFYGPASNTCAPAERNLSLGMDIWAHFLMSGVIPERVRVWFERWHEHITYAHGRAAVEIAPADTAAEASSTPLATAWAFCLAQELGQGDLAEALRNTLRAEVMTGFALDPLLSGLYLLGDVLQPGAFHRLVVGPRESPGVARAGAV